MTFEGDRRPEMFPAGKTVRRGAIELSPHSLKRYLQTLAFKFLQGRHSVLTYVDGFFRHVGVGRVARRSFTAALSQNRT